MATSLCLGLGYVFVFNPSLRTKVIHYVETISLCLFVCLSVCLSVSSFVIKHQPLNRSPDFHENCGNISVKHFVNQNRKHGLSGIHNVIIGLKDFVFIL